MAFKYYGLHWPLITYADHIIGMNRNRYQGMVLLGVNSPFFNLMVGEKLGVWAFDFWIRSKSKYESILGFGFGFDIETSYIFGFEAESERLVVVGV